MRSLLKLGAPTTLVAAAILGAAMTGSATAGEFCRQDVTGHMTGCGYSTIEQCQAASAGIGGDCFRDPHLADKASSSSANAFAYSPKAAKRGHAGGNAANGSAR